jgi:hypothetical protein
MDWKKVALDFASTYLLPVLGIFMMVIVGLGLLGIAGFVLRHVAIPIVTFLVLLAVIALLTVEMVWRLSTFNALLGLILTYPAVAALMREPLQAIFGIVIGALGALTLHLYGDTLKAAEHEKRVMSDATGKTYQAVVLSGNSPDIPMLASALISLAVTSICWVFREYGALSLFISLYASLALGRAISWISVEADTQTLYFWQPFAFLRKVPGFSHFFQWWRQVRHLLGIGIAHWAQE